MRTDGQTDVTKLKAAFFFNVNNPEVFTYVYKLHYISRIQQTVLLY